MSEQGENQYLTFVLNDELYAVPVGKVREVLEYTKPSKLPKTAAYMKGIINVRGTGIPVVDLRTKFGMPEIAVTRESAILVLEIRDSDGGQNVIGALADEVREVIEIKDEDLENAPRFGTRIDTGFIHSVGKRDGQFVIVLDIDRAFDDEDVSILAEPAAPTKA
jgi:purine-binding chemotaxis protein CheW